MADERSWDLIYSAVIDLTKAVNGLREEMNNRFKEVNSRLDRIEEGLDRLEHDNKYTKIRLHDVENEIRFLKETRRV
ncbi:hypothetical protein LSG31_13040 [Fodinisporobacter ferrooxydans]|uniref:Uncharacterized protein n=1 Tax=Fodinisporobacter ferrooxydans TaxID=2901836 RepID=A0ABY4CEG9_9BACL|nr:hypothetical protein LSG31_13040 [Alicyclobacillaceae bacterium MYW30-H2]